MNRTWIIQHESYENEGCAYKVFTNWTATSKEIKCNPELLLYIRQGDKIIVNDYIVTVENVD